MGRYGIQSFLIRLRRQVGSREGRREKKTRARSSSRSSRLVFMSALSEDVVHYFDDVRWSDVQRRVLLVLARRRCFFGEPALAGETCCMASSAARPARLLLLLLLQRQAGAAVLEYRRALSFRTAASCCR